jgi:hypothetical protein
VGDVYELSIRGVDKDDAKVTYTIPLSVTFENPPPNWPDAPN